MKKIKPSIGDIRLAFDKLQSYIYFDNNDLYWRHQLSEFKEKYEESIETVFNILNDNELANKYLDKISLRIYPKKLEPKEISQNHKTDNFYTNEFLTEGANLTRLAIFIDIPIELQIVNTLWIMEYADTLEGDISPCAFGNRLISEKALKNEGRSLFKPYHKQYQNWWGNAINTAKSHLEKNQNVTIINFDFKDCFHRIRFKMNDLSNNFRLNDKDSDSPLHQIFVDIHERYKIELLKIEHEAMQGISDEEFPLPIGLLSSYILANYFFKEFDTQILEKINPSYYGRYVDDLLLIVKDTLITKEKLKNDNKESLLEFYSKEYLSSTFSIEGDVLKLNLSKYSNILLQKEKVFIYQFNAKHSPNLLNKFVEDQKERNYEFRFLSDDSDESFQDFESITFEQNFETTDLNKARFKEVEDNKFKLSVFLAKLIQRRILNGPEYGEGEIDKVEKYFKGIYLLKHYYFWEKLLTLYMVSERSDAFIRLVKNVWGEIEKLEGPGKGKSYLGISSSNNNKMMLNEVKKSFRAHMKHSLQMALGLNPDFLENILSKTKRDESVEVLHEVLVG